MPMRVEPGQERTCPHCGWTGPGMPSGLWRCPPCTNGRVRAGPTPEHRKRSNAINSQRCRLVARARNRAFVDEINARTVCAHCGAQPIEWHNPDHVALGLQRHRIGNMVGGGRTLLAIQEEMDHCTPLCRRCHLREDGRLEILKKHRGVSEKMPSKPCSACGAMAKPLARQMCSKCYDRLWRPNLKNRRNRRERYAAIGAAEGQP